MTTMTTTRTTWTLWTRTKTTILRLGGMQTKQAPPCPRFVVTIRPSSRTQHLSLAAPGCLWELKGNMLECNDLQLKGPNKAICKVKANRTYDDEKLTVRLDSGWRAFRAANRLRVGDVLGFFLVGNSCFTVDLLDRIEKN